MLNATSFSLIMLIPIDWNGNQRVYYNMMRHVLVHFRTENRLVLCFYVFITESIAALASTTIEAVAKLFVFRWYSLQSKLPAMAGESTFILWNLLMLLCCVVWVCEASVQCHYTFCRTIHLVEPESAKANIVRVWFRASASLASTLGGSLNAVLRNRHSQFQDDGVGISRRYRCHDSRHFTTMKRVLFSSYSSS